MRTIKCADASTRRTSNVKAGSRLVLMAGCSLLCLVYGNAAWALDIDEPTTTPATTSTDGEVTITEDGEIDISGQAGTAAVTVDSDNDVTNDGAVIAEDTDDVTGIRVLPDTVSTITIGGTIQLDETYEREDEDEDGDLDGPLASGRNRTGILVEPGGTLTGDILLGQGSSIIVEGNDSAGVLVGSVLDGSFISDGSISVTGDNARGLSFAQEVTGDILLSGNLSAQGANATGVAVTGPIGGAFTIEADVVSSGFVATDRSNYVSPSNEDEDTPPLDERLDADDLYDNDSAVTITGSVSGGVLINGAVDDFTSAEDAEDETKDTLDDFDENRSTGSIRSFGSGAALQITTQTADEDVVLSPVFETVRDTLDDDEDEDTTEALATFQLDQGLINRGSILANGLNVGFAATAVDISGSDTGAGRVIIEGGILNTGSITSTAFEANSVALNLGAGTVVGSLENSGSIIANVATRENHTGTAVRVAEGVELTEITNDGIIRGLASGDGAAVSAISVESASLTSVTNTGTISAFFTSDSQASEGVSPGFARALDFSTLSQDITLTQDKATPVDDRNGDGEINSSDVPEPVLRGDVVFGSGNDTFHLLDGGLTGDVYFGSGSADFEIRSASVTGDTWFEGTASSLTISSSTYTGDIQFGSGMVDALVRNGSVVEGDLFSDAASDVALSVQDATINFLRNTDLTLTSFSVTGDSELGFEIDPQALRDTPYINVLGSATIGDGTIITPTLTSFAASDFSIDLVQATQLTFEGELAGAQIANLPWIYTAELTQDDTLSIDFQLKSAEQLGLDANQANAYQAVLQVAEDRDDLGLAISSVTDSKRFMQAYNLLLPQRTDASTRYLETQFNGAYGALRNHFDLARLAPGERSSFWIQETFAHLDRSESDQTPGYNGRGVGFAMGADRPWLGLDMVGIMLTYSDGKFEEKTGGAKPVNTNSLGIGAYVMERFGPVDLQVAGQYADLSFSSKREIVVEDFQSNVSGDWGGSAMSASATASSELGSGLFRATPYASLDYISLEQDGYSETGTAGLGLEIGSAESDRLTASAGVGFAAVWQPRTGRGAYSSLSEGYAGSGTVSLGADIGYRSVMSSTPYRAEANFIGYDEVFAIEAQEDAGEAVTAGISLIGFSDILSAKLGLGTEISDDMTAYTANASVKVRF